MRDIPLLTSMKYPFLPSFPSLPSNKQEEHGKKLFWKISPVEVPPIKRGREGMREAGWPGWVQHPFPTSSTVSSRGALPVSRPPQRGSGSGQPFREDKSSEASAGGSSAISASALDL